MSIELAFVIVVGVTAMIFVLFLFSIFGKPPAEDVRNRMEQYLVEAEMAAKQYIPPDEEMERSRDEPSADEGADAWVMEQRGDTSGVKKVLGNVGSILTPKSMAAKIALNLARADIPLKANEFVAIQFLTVMLPLLFGFSVMKNLLLGIVFGVCGYFVPLIWLSIKKAQRMSAFREQILDTLVMMANGLKAGYSFLQAMEMVARESHAPMSTELRRVLKENSLGMNLEDCLRALNQRVESEDWDLVTTVVLIQRQVGGNLAEIMDKIGYTIRQRMRIKGDIQTKTAQAKISGLLVGCLPFGIAFMIYLINPNFMMRLFTFKYGWFRGWFVVIAGFVWEAIGLYIIMKIVDIEV